MPTNNETTPSQNIFLFELEGAALDGRGKLFDAAQAVFKAAGLELSRQAFARCCVHAAPSYVAEQLVATCGGGKLGDDAVERIVAEYVERMRNADHNPAPKFVEVMDAAARRGIRMIALTVLPAEVAQKVLDRSGLAGKGVELALFPESERHFPRTDCWLRIPRASNRSPRACIAVAGCRDSGKSALAAGMRCIVVPDQFTAFQDFSGVDGVFDGSDDVPAAELLAAIC